MWVQSGTIWGRVSAPPIWFGNEMKEEGKARNVLAEFRVSTWRKVGADEKSGYLVLGPSHEKRC